MSKTYLSSRAAALSPAGHFIARSAFIFLMLCVPALLAAQGNGVKVSNLAVSVGSPTTVTFNVSWQTPMPVALWSDTVWVFVDYNNNGKMERLPVTGATLTATSASGVGKVVEDAGNNQGVWIVGDAREHSSFSATVQLFTSVKDVAGACAYASNYPPVAEYIAVGQIAFTGTPPYNVVLKDVGGSTETRTESSPYTVPVGYMVQSFTDKTGAPGKLDCIPPEIFTLVASASSFCEGDAGISFTLLGTDDGASYELYREGTPEAVTTLEGSGSAATFSDAVNVAGTYSVRTVLGGAFCPATMSNTITVTVTQPGTANNAATACGCASGLDVCNGVCQSCCDCTRWAFCSGFTEISSLAYESIGNWSTANSHCKNKGDGWRLPTKSEMECMSTFGGGAPPGGYLKNNAYWTGTARSGGYYQCTLVDAACVSVYASSSLPFKCVR
jgi:hypothetical protein